MMTPKHSNSMPSRTEGWELQRQRNARTGWILASVAAVFFAGFMAKMLLLGG